jgi:hypothetical protein
MFGNSEAQCIESIINFIRESPQFRPITLKDEGSLLQEIDPRRSFIIVKGSYKTIDILIGILLNYDITSPGKAGSAVSIMYRMQCESGLDVVFTREFHYDQASKKIGPKPEIELGDPDVDDAFIIHTEDAQKIKMLLPSEPFRNFLLKHKKNLEKLEVKPDYIEYQRSIFHKDSKKEAEIDFEDLSELVSSLSREGERLSDI